MSTDPADGAPVAREPVEPPVAGGGGTFEEAAADMPAVAREGLADGETDNRVPPTSTF
jgi:hypothetical protein